MTVGRIERVTLTSYQAGEIDYWTMRDAMSPLDGEYAATSQHDQERSRWGYMSR